MFPIYDTIIDEINANDFQITDESIDIFLAAIPKLPIEKKEICYALIRKYQIINEPLGTFILPYGAKYMKKGGLRFNFTEFPLKLQKVLIKFIDT